MPHNPVRFADTIGIVVEVPRPKDQLGTLGFDVYSLTLNIIGIDSLRWYCEKCREIVYQESFYCVDLGVQLKPVIDKWTSEPQRRWCTFDHLFTD